MLKSLASFVRNRWHPLWRLRKSSLFRRFQNRVDRTVYTRLPDTGLNVAVRFLRDASLIANPALFEPEVRTAFALVLQSLNPAAFWDVGANIGFYTWLVRRHPSIRQVVMFEPDPTNFSLIGETIRKNAISDVRALNVALSDHTGEASFLLDRASGAAGSLESISHRENNLSLHHAYALNETITCHTATIDGLIAEGIPAPQFIKIDVEGAEHLVLAGAENCLARHHPVMIIETSNRALVRRLRDSGYTAFRIDAGNLLFIATAGARNLEPIRQSFAAYV